jgi:hypothetical protein
MVESQAIAGELATARRLVELLEQDGFGLAAAVWAVDEEGEGRLYLVPSQQNDTDLKQTIRVAYTISQHKDELPDRHDLRYSIVDSGHPVVQAVRSASSVAGKVRGVYKNGTYIDTAYVLRPAA